MDQECFLLCGKMRFPVGKINGERNLFLGSVSRGGFSRHLNYGKTDKKDGRIVRQ